MREQWGTRTGFILATIGSAVGLGNIWRFAYVAGENGGGAFLIVYLLLVIAIGMPLVIAELAIGKRGAADAVTAFELLAPHSAFRLVAWISVAGAVILLSYYAVIAGWALRYFIAAASGDLLHEAAGEYGGYFARFIGNFGEPLAWQTAMLAGAMLVVAGGVTRGIERANGLLMPLLALIIVALAAYSLTRPGSARGVAFLLAPDWRAIADPQVIVAALGQALFSVGVGVAVFVTYGSYMRREFSIPGSAAIVVLGDTLFAIVAGLAIFPAVFAFGGDPAAGPELAFITLPQVFVAMPGGRLVAPVFFFLLSAAALTSMVALLEVPVAALMHRLDFSRRRAVMLVGVVILVIGTPSGLSYGLLRGVTILGLPILDAADAAVSNLMLPLAGFGLAIFAGWILPRALAMALAELPDERLALTFLWTLRLIPVLMAGLLAYRALGG